RRDVRPVAAQLGIPDVVEQHHHYVGRPLRRLRQGRPPRRRLLERPPYHSLKRLLLRHGRSALPRSDLTRGLVYTTLFPHQNGGGAMHLALTLGYWGAQPNHDAVALAQEAERLGFDSVWVAESWGNDAFTFLTWLAAHTERVRLGTGVVQLAARTPTATAMAAMTLDHLSGGRVILGLGVSGPQVVEGWYGRPSDHPLARTREYVEIIRAALRRDGPLVHDGAYYPLPYRGEG